MVTIGVFDGVHRGHQHIVGAAVARARKMTLPAVVITFEPHPSEVVRPGTHPALLTTLDRKTALLGGLGVEAVVVIPFTPEFSRLEPAEFAHEVLVEHLHAAAVVVGENFRFGYKAAGDISTLRSLGSTFGFATEAVQLVREGETTFSSTYIRACIDAGDVAAAADALGRDHRLEGIVVRGAGRGRALGYPTANMHIEPHTAIPADGVYAGHAIVGDRRFLAAISVGTNPTFDGTARTVEPYLLDFDEDLYGHTIAVEFGRRLRGMLRFERVEDLITQMARDVAATRSLSA